MLKIHAKYQDKNGEVVLFNENNAFPVMMKKQIRAGNWKCYLRVFYDIEEAIDYYKVCIDQLNNRLPARICVINPNRRRKCCAKNCPKKLGGDAYWRLFRESCLFRTR